MERYNALFSLTGKKALISGGTGGLGSAIAEAFLQQGAEVAVCGRHPDKARDMNCLLPAEDYGDQEFSQVMELNIHALHRLTREVGRRWMIPGRYGRILNLSSVKSMIGTTENYAAYCASKGAVNMYTRQLACEWGKYGITCNAIAPTFVRTPINSFQLDDAAFYKKLTERIPLGRIGSKQDIAAAAVFLCSDAAAFISGQILCVDGGLTAMQ